MVYIRRVCESIAKEVDDGEGAPKTSTVSLSVDTKLLGRES
jgi:N-acetylglutamate synthase/N-acetylornithine aminotransferase